MRVFPRPHGRVHELIKKPATLRLADNDGSPLLRAIAGMIALVGFDLLAMHARAGASEQSTRVQNASSERLRPTRCDAIQEWTRETLKAFATSQSSVYGLEPRLAHAVMETLRAQPFAG